MSSEQTGANPTPSHEIKQIWTAISEITALQKAQAQIVDQIHTDFRAFAHRIDERINKPTNWFGMISGVVGVVTIVGTFVVLLVGEVKDLTIFNREITISHNDLFHETDKELYGTIMYIKGRQELIIDRQKSTDLYGNRKWNDGSPETK